jgi:hypothetical protein
VPEPTLTQNQRVTAAVRWLLAPAIEEVPRSQAAATTVLRILVGLMWLYNVSWKRAPDFGQDADNGLYKFTSYAVSDPVLPPFSWLVEHVVLPNFTPFGWAVLAAETALAVLLLTGSWVRLAALVGVVQSLAIALSVAYAPHEWPWSYWLMIGAHLVLLGSSSGRLLAVDGVRAGVSPARSVGQVWGSLTVLVGLYSVARSLADPLASRGPGLRSTDLSVSLGEYNLLGGLVLVVAGGLVLVSARGGPALAGRVAAGLAVLAALSLHAQLGFADPVLGGTPTSAAFLLAVALVAATLGGLTSRRTDPHSAAEGSAQAEEESR